MSAFELRALQSVRSKPYRLLPYARRLSRLREGLGVGRLGRGGVLMMLDTGPPPAPPAGGRGELAHPVTASRALSPAGPPTLTPHRFQLDRAHLCWRDGIFEEKSIAAGVFGAV